MFSFISAGLWKGYINKGICHPSCQSTFFRVVKSGENTGDKREAFGVNILFDKSVTVTESHFSINFLTLLTRIGGAVGVGKEGLWLITIALNQISNFCFNANFKSENKDN